jgi:uncharacterized protein YegJ (DUF2314 family)
MRYCLILLLIVFAACKGNRNVVQKVEEKDGEKVYTVDAAEEQMKEAMQEAIRTFPLFEQAMQSPDTTLTGFAVRMKFNQGSENMHLWLKNLRGIGGQLFGVLDSQPTAAEGLKQGDTLRVVRNDITDWMYVKAGKLQGGYTLRVLYNSMDEEMKKQFRNSVPFVIE